MFYKLALLEESIIEETLNHTQSPRCSRVHNLALCECICSYWRIHAAVSVTYFL